MDQKDISDANYEMIKSYKPNIVGMALVLFFVASFTAVLFFTSCSLALQNINIDDINANGKLDSVFPQDLPINEQMPL